MGFVLACYFTDILLFVEGALSGALSIIIVDFCRNSLKRWFSNQSLNQMESVLPSNKTGASIYLSRFAVMRLVLCRPFLLRSP